MSTHHFKANSSPKKSEVSHRSTEQSGYKMYINVITPPSSSLPYLRFTQLSDPVWWKSPSQFWHHGHPWIFSMDWISWENVNRKTPDFMGKSMVSGFNFPLIPWNSLPPPFAPPVPGNWSWCIAHTASSRRHFDCSAGRGRPVSGLPPVQMRLGAVFLHVHQPNWYGSHIEILWKVDHWDLGHWTSGAEHGM